MVQLVQTPLHLGLQHMAVAVVVELSAELDEMVHLVAVVAVGAVFLLVEKVFTLAQLILMRLDKGMMEDVAVILEAGNIPVVAVELEV
jgi:hypothetical protein